MITKMKKLTFLVYYKEYEAFLNGVRDLGVVHVAEKQQGVADNTELQDSIRLSARLQATERLLQAFKPARPAVNPEYGSSQEQPDAAARYQSLNLRSTWRKHPPRQPADWKC